MESSDLSPDDSSDYTDDTDDTDDDEDAMIDLHAQIEPFREALREERHLHHETRQKLEDLRVSNHKLITELQEDRDEIKYLKETLKNLLAGSKARDELLKSELAQNEIEKVVDTDQAKEKNTQGGSDKKEKPMRTKFKHAPDTATASKDVAKYVQQLKDLHEEIDALRHENIELRAANKKIRGNMRIICMPPRGKQRSICWNDGDSLYCNGVSVLFKRLCHIGNRVPKKKGTGYK